MSAPVFHALAEAARAGEKVSLGIISAVKGSSPQKVGAKAVFYADGRIVGTVGGGCLEAEIQQRAIQALRDSTPCTFDLLLDHDFGWDDGLICGGKVQGIVVPNAQSLGEQFWGKLQERKTAMTWGVGKDFALGLSEVGETHNPDDPEHSGRSGLGCSFPNHQEWLYLETVRPPTVLWIAGAGHIAQAVAPLALQLDFAVTVFDDRPALANRQFFPPGVSLKADVWENLLKVPLPDTPAFGLIVTRGHRHDALVLQDWIHKPFPFVGMIGSARKARTIFAHFLEEKIATPEELKRVACPVGVKIRSQSVMEIAVSIMAQFIDKRGELAGEKPAEI